MDEREKYNEFEFHQKMFVRQMSLFSSSSIDIEFEGHNPSDALMHDDSLSTHRTSGDTVLGTFYDNNTRVSLSSMLMLPFNPLCIYSSALLNASSP